MQNDQPGDGAELFGKAVYYVFYALAVVAVAVIVAAIGALIGTVHAVGNYVTAFRHQVIDSNRECPETERSVQRGYGR